MFQIINDGEHTKIFISELEIYIKGDFEIKKKGTEVPNFNEISNQQ